MTVKEMERKLESDCPERRKVEKIAGRSWAQIDKQNRHVVAVTLAAAENSGVRFLTAEEEEECRTIL